MQYNQTKYLALFQTSKREFFVSKQLHVVLTFLIGIHSMQSCTITQGMELQEKKEEKYEIQRGKLFRRTQR